MSATDFFYISAGFGIWLGILTWLFIFIKIIRLITKIELEINFVKNTFKLSGLKLMSKILSTVKGGDTNGK